MHISEWVFELTVAAFLITALFTVARVSSRERKMCRDTMQVLGSALLTYERQMHEAMLLIKASSPSEAVKAQHEERSLDLKVKYLQDALAKAEVDTKPVEPTFVTTTDGRKFDLRDLEVM
jgi:hypothetical protein